MTSSIACARWYSRARRRKRESFSALANAKERRVERHGGMLKGMARKVVAQTQAVGWVDLQSVVDECCTTTNHLLRTGHSGF